MHPDVRDKGAPLTGRCHDAWVRTRPNKLLNFQVRVQPHRVLSCQLLHHHGVAGAAPPPRATQTPRAPATAAGTRRASPAAGAAPRTRVSPRRMRAQTAACDEQTSGLGRVPA